MRLRSNLFHVFFALLFIAASIVEASKWGKRNKKKRNKKKGKGKKLGLTTPSGSGGGTLIECNSGPSLESEKAKENKASVREAFSIVEGDRSEVVSSAVSESGAESDDALGKEFREAFDGGDFEWLNAHWARWGKRKDLLDDVIRKGADVTVKLIQKVEDARKYVLAALFDEGEEGMIDEVLEGIKYEDDDLCSLTNYRPELAGSHEKYFRVLDKIKKPWKQESAVRWGVINLFRAGKRDLVAPLVNALGKRTFKSKSLKNVAIRMAFTSGADGGNQGIVELYYEHLVITSREYAGGLYDSWNEGQPNQVFPFLLEQADQGDLAKAKEVYADEEYEQFSQAIDTAPKPVPPAGTRHRRPIERARIAMNVLDALGHGGLISDTVDIITGYAATDDALSMAMKVFDRFRDPGIPPVISAMIAEYIGGADMIAGDKEQA